MKKKATISLVLGTILSAAALYLAFRNVPFADLSSYLRSINYFWILPAIGVVVIVFALRAYRWQIILESSRKVNFWKAYHPLMIGFMINCVLPGRVGEVARPAVLHKQERIPFSTGLATVAAERVFDVSILIILFGILLATVRIDPNLDIAFGGYHLNRQTLVIAGRSIFQMLLLLIAGIVMVGFGKTRKMINRVIMAIPSLLFFADSGVKARVQTKICVPIVAFIENFASGFSLVKHPKKIYLCIVLSFIIWGLSAFSYFIMAQGCPGITLSFAEISAVMIIICFFIALPSVPGFWGIWEAGGVFALTLFGVSAKDAAGFTLANHAVQVFPVILAGFISAMITSINIWQVSYEDIEANRV